MRIHKCTRIHVCVYATYMYTWAYRCDICTYACACKYARVPIIVHACMYVRTHASMNALTLHACTR